MAAVSRCARLKSISRKMVSVPVESVTDLKTCSTETIEEVSLPTETTGSAMSALLKNLEITTPDFNKLVQLTLNRLLKPLGAALLGSMALLAQLPTAQAQQRPTTILVVGDSLSAEYGLKRGTGWVPLLEKQLALEKKPVAVVNASISGDTTSGGRSRLAPLLSQHKPDIVVIELGGNDALRGLPLDMTESNLSAMVQGAKKAGAKVLLVGMQVPPNYGGAYAATFSGLFGKVAKTEKVSLVPFFLKGIADVDDAPARFQADRIHPNQQSQTLMLANVWPELKKLIR